MSRTGYVWRGQTGEADVRQPSIHTHPSIHLSIYLFSISSILPPRHTHPSIQLFIHPQTPENNTDQECKRTLQHTQTQNVSGRATPTRTASGRLNILRPSTQADAQNRPGMQADASTPFLTGTQENLKHDGVYVTGLSALMQRAQLRKNKFQHWGWALSFPASCFLWPRRLTKEIKHTSRTKVNFTNEFSRSPPNFNFACDTNCDHHRLHPQRH